jgi:hypothetical protein
MSDETVYDKLERVILTTGLIAGVLFVVLYWR